MGRLWEMNKPRMNAVEVSSRLGELRKPPTVVPYSSAEDASPVFKDIDIKDTAKKAAAAVAAAPSFLSYLLSPGQKQDLGPSSAGPTAPDAPKSPERKPAAGVSADPAGDTQPVKANDSQGQGQAGADSGA